MIPFYAYDVCFPRGTFEREMRNRGLKLVRFRSLIRYNHQGVRLSKDLVGEKYVELCQTPLGTIRRCFQKNPGRIMDPDADIQCEWWVKKLEDFAPLIYYLQDGIHCPQTSLAREFLEVEADLGEDGQVNTGVEFSPDVTAIHMLGLEGWVRARHEWPHRYQELVAVLADYNALQYHAAMELQPSHLIMASEVTDNISPALYETEVLPWFERYAPGLRAAGHTIGVHAHALRLSHYRDVVHKMDADWIESFTPPPGGNLSLKDARKAWGDKVFIWVNVPEGIFYEGAGAVTRWTKELLAEDPGSNMAVGFSEMGMMGVTSEIREIFQDGVRAIAEVLHAV